MKDDTPIANFLKRLLVFMDNAGADPLNDSPAANDIRSFPRPESVRTAFSQAAQSFISATDYFEALDALVRMKRFAVAPWSCARGMVESSAICTWLLEMNIGPKERVSRSLSLRYAALREQEKMARYDADSGKLRDIGERIETIENIAIALGFEVLRDAKRKNRRTGIGQVKPSITALVERQFSGENIYRIFSGMAHSDYTSLTTFSFVKSDSNGSEGALLVRAVPTDIQAEIVKFAAKVYAKCVWLQTIQFGFDAAEMAILLEELYDQLKLPDTDADRFWRLLVRTGS